jgi:quercetin dioxygenase-like cupin family protein
MDDVRQLAEFAAFSEQKLQKHSVFQTPRFFLDVYCLRPGQAQKIHAHPDSDKVYVVLEGRCRFTVGEESAEHGSGAAVLARAGVAHGVENASGADARLLVMMSPPPPHA